MNADARLMTVPGPVTATYVRQMGESKVVVSNVAIWYVRNVFRTCEKRRGSDPAQAGGCPSPVGRSRDKCDLQRKALVVTQRLVPISTARSFCLAP